MTDRLNGGGKTAQTKRSPEEWCDIGNAHLARIGRSHELHWFVLNGRATIGYRR